MTGRNQGARAGGQRRLDLSADEVGGAGAHHRSQIGVRVQRMAEAIGAGQLDEAIDEVAVAPALHIDAFDAAAGLAGVEKGAVHQIFYRRRQVGVGAHIGRILPAQFQADADEALGGRPLHRAAAAHRTGEGDEVDLGRGRQLQGGGMVQLQGLEHADGQAGGGARLAE